MSVATATQTPSGWRITGGTDATTVTNNKVWVKRFCWYSAAADDTATIANNASTTVFTIPGATAKTLYTHDIGGESGAPFDGLKVTLTGATDVLTVFIR